MTDFELTETDKEIIKKANIQGRIKAVLHFSTNDNKKYVIIINKVSRLYAIRLINYDGDENENKVEILAVKRYPNLVEFYQTKEDAAFEANEIKRHKKIYECRHKFETYEDVMENNILLIGRTGSGKSALANVISGTDVFKEGDGLVGVTKNFQIQDFEVKGNHYRVIDTIGVGDTDLSPKKVMMKLAEAIHSMKRGIKQIFVVVGGRLTKEEMELFELAEKIFERRTIRHTTIVRNKFVCFDDQEKCEQDKEYSRNKDKRISNLIGQCNGIIYVNNPPLSGNERRREIAQEDRRKSREIILRHLNTRCKGNYKMDRWDDICVGINDYMNAKKWKENESTRNSLYALKINKEIDNLKRDIIEEIEIRAKDTKDDREVHCLTNVTSHLLNAEVMFKAKNFCSIT